MSDDVQPWVREAVKFRAMGRCEWCGRRIDRPDLHHRLFRSRGGGHGPENLVALCGFGNTSGCHGRAHREEEAAQAAGMTIATGGDPLAVPIHSVVFGLTMWIRPDGFTTFDDPGLGSTPDKANAPGGNPTHSATHPDYHEEGSSTMSLPTPHDQRTSEALS